MSVINLQAAYPTKFWRMSEDLVAARNRFLNERLPQLKLINEKVDNRSRPPGKFHQVRASPVLPSINNGPTSRSGVGNNSLASSVTPSDSSPPPSYAVGFHLNGTLENRLQRNGNNAAPSPPQSSVNPSRTKRVSLYDHVQSKINTGLPRIDHNNRQIVETHQLGPTRQLNWAMLKQEIEQDTKIRAQAKRLQFNSGVTYNLQVTSLTNLVRTKVKQFVSSTLGHNDERYKIVVNLSIFQASTVGLHIASRCLWNTQTDGSITIRMQGIDCDLLFVVFLCYTI